MLLSGKTLDIPARDASMSARELAVWGALALAAFEGVVGLYVQAAVAQIVLFAIFVGVLFVRPGGLLGVEQR